MYIKGDEVKKIRKSLGLSQIELAAGICSQATISLIEKENRLPKSSTLTKICDRLQIPIGQVIVYDHQTMQQNLDRLAKEIMVGDVEQIEAAMDTIIFDDLTSKEEKFVYQVYSGLAKLRAGKNKEATFEFQNLLGQAYQSDFSTYIPLVMYGNGLTYLVNEDHRYAEGIFDNIYQSLRNVNLRTSYWKVILYSGLASAMLEMQKPGRALEMIDEAIETARELDSLYPMSGLFLIRAQVERSLKKDTESDADFKAAQQLADLNQQTYVQQQLNRFN